MKFPILNFLSLHKVYCKNKLIITFFLNRISLRLYPIKYDTVTKYAVNTSVDYDTSLEWWASLANSLLISMEIINLFWLILQCHFHSWRRNPAQLLIILSEKGYLKMNGELHISIRMTTLQIYLQSHFLVVRNERSSLRWFYTILHNIEVETTASCCPNFRWILCWIWVIFPKYVTLRWWVLLLSHRIHFFNYILQIDINKLWSFWGEWWKSCVSTCDVRWVFNHSKQQIYEYFIKSYNFYFLLFFHLTTKLPRNLTDTHLQSVYQCTHYA